MNPYTERRISGMQRGVRGVRRPRASSLRGASKDPVFLKEV